MQVYMPLYTESTFMFSRWTFTSTQINQGIVTGLSGLFQGIYVSMMHHKSMLTLMDQKMCPRGEGDIRGDVCTSSEWIFY